MRGEQVLQPRQSARRFGSSPHARGTVRADVQTGQARRFIPACAGNSPDFVYAALARPVHPRMRGEQLRRGVLLDVHGGSSPHARGTEFNLNMTAFARRFIPACAGNS